MPDESVEDVKRSLAEVGYLADEPAALVSFLAQKLGKPVKHIYTRSVASWETLPDDGAERDDGSG